MFRLADAPGKPEVAARQDLGDRPAIQANDRKRVTGGTEVLPAAPDTGDVRVWLQRNLQCLGDSALSQAITLDMGSTLVRDTLLGLSDRFEWHSRRSPLQDQ